MDVVEIDAASNRSIEDIRTLRETIKFMPAEGHKKIYIIDEVHMLTTEAFNALLKTLEEPPGHVRISTPQEVSQITIPKTAVRTKDSGDFVYIVNDSGLADVRSILTGDEEAGRVVVLDGLKDGERVVADPPQSLEIGMKVTT